MKLSEFIKMYDMYECSQEYLEINKSIKSLSLMESVLVSNEMYRRNNNLNETCFANVLPDEEYAELQHSIFIESQNVFKRMGRAISEFFKKIGTAISSIFKKSDPAPIPLTDENAMALWDTNWSNTAQLCDANGNIVEVTESNKLSMGQRVIGVINFTKDKFKGKSVDEDEFSNMEFAFVDKSGKRLTLMTPAAMTALADIFEAYTNGDNNVGNSVAVYNKRKNLATSLKNFCSEQKLDSQDRNKFKYQISHILYDEPTMNLYNTVIKGVVEAFEKAEQTVADEKNVADEKSKAVDDAFIDIQRRIEIESNKLKEAKKNNDDALIKLYTDRVAEITKEFNDKRAENIRNNEDYRNSKNNAHISAQKTIVGSGARHSQHNASAGFDDINRSMNYIMTSIKSTLYINAEIDNIRMSIKRKKPILGIKSNKEQNIQVNQ